MKTLKKMLGITLIIFGLLSTISGVILVMNPTTETTQNLQQVPTVTENQSQNIDNQVTNTPVIESKVTEKEIVENKITESKPIETKAAETPQQEETTEKKGLEFTKAVIAKFDKKYFKLKEWRSDKFDGGVYPEANMYPDLEFEFNLRDTKSLFAIECKWRKNYYKNGIEWAKDYQLKNYKKFKTDKNIPVFVAIGVGGTPEKPSEVYIVPLSAIENTFITQTELKNYQKADFQDKNFFYDSKTESLK
jgi:hypothetical protein